jgi:two-component system, sensor histidine kinase and response regulator
MDRSIDLTGMKVLIVDDNPVNIDILSKTLRREGYEFSFAKNGEKALKIAEKIIPDIILLDIMMPGMDGYEVCERLKQDITTRDIPVIFISALTETEDIVRGFDLKAVDYITKPFKKEEVLSRVKTHLCLRLAQQCLLDSNYQKNKFLGIVAHDLRNPINGIVGFSEMVLDEVDSIPRDEIKECLEMVTGSSRQMLELINQLLDISAIENGQLDLTCIETTLQDLLEQRVHINHFSAEKKGIKIHQDYQQNESVNVDPQRMIQVVDNLLTNAIKFSSLGKNIYVSLSRQDKYLNLSIRDEGPGISSEDQQHLFCDFKKLTAKPTAGEKSTGLGLAIVKKIVDSHNGEIRVESELGVGATFNVLLPLV